MRNIFISKYHQSRYGWTYWFHLGTFSCNSYKLIKISFKSLVHGLLPFIWKSDAPKGVIILYHEIMKIQHIKKLDKLRKYPKNERYISNDTE